MGPGGPTTSPVPVPPGMLPHAAAVGPDAMGICPLVGVPVTVTPPILPNRASLPAATVPAAVPMLALSVTAGLPVTTMVVSAGATDSMFFRALGIPAYGVSGIFMKSSDEFAHGLNERVPVASIDGALAHWESLLRDLAR